MRLAAWMIVCGASILVPACWAQQNPPSRGREVTKLYTEKCANCHGADMGGGSASSLIDGTWRYGGDDASMANSIRHGHAGMPAMEKDFDAAEIRGLVIYIRERSAAFKTAHTKYNTPVPDEIVQSEKASFKLDPVMESGLDTPWAIAFLPDGRMLVTERPGRLRLIENGKLLPDPVRGIPAVYGGEGGLLDVALHPDYSRPGNDWIYLSYGDKSPGGLAMSAVIRGRLRNGAFVDQQQIFKADDSLYRVGGQRFGSRLLFDSKGHLFFSVGDRACPGDEQDLSQPNGKVHRVNDDGSIPADNPFADRPGAIRSIWTYGHRNSQGLAFNPISGDLWEAEHGPRGGDELNILHRGHNYGWPIITYGMNYDGTPITDHTAHPGMDQPVTSWVPSIATSALTFYTGNRFPQWKNNLFLGSLAAQELLRLDIDGEKVTHEEILFKGIGRVRNVVNGPDGYLYVVLNQPDRIERMVPADASVKRPPPPTRDPHTPGYVPAKELPDGENAPANVDGNFILGPTHKPAPEMTVQEGVPQGTVSTFTMESKDSKFYPGIAREPHTFGTPDPADPAKLTLKTSHPAPYSRRVTVYVPKQYVPGRAAPFIVGADGPDPGLFTALNNLIAERRLPVMIAISISNGGGDAQGSERGLEYDTMSGRYAEFVEQEVLPRVEKQYNLRLTKNPEGRATMGGSSGGSCALIMAWYHPELYHRVLTYSGTYVNQQWPSNPQTPHGAWGFHERLIPNSPAKPLRIWMEVGDRDLFNPNVMRDNLHDWVVANEDMAKVLAAKGYHYQFVFARNAGHVDRAVKQQTLPEALEYVWQGYPGGQAN